MGCSFFVLILSWAWVGSNIYGLFFVLILSWAWVGSNIYGLSFLCVNIKLGVGGK